jgi:hypothetical protein
VEQLGVLLVNRLDTGRISLALSHPGNDGGYWIARHEAGEEKIQQEGGNESDDEPGQLVTEVPQVSFQLITSGLSLHP